MPTQEDYFGKSESSSVWKPPTPEKPKEQIKVEEKPKGATVDWNNKPRSYEVTVDVPKSAAQKVDTRMTASELADKAILAPIDFSMFIQNKKEETPVPPEEKPAKTEPFPKAAAAVAQVNDGDITIETSSLEGMSITDVVKTVPKENNSFLKNYNDQQKELHALMKATGDESDDGIADQFKPTN